MNIPAKWIRNASDDLAVRKGCYFDERPGLLLIGFIETFCIQSKGEWGDKPLKLLDWQKDFLMRLFGWRMPDGTRRFKRFYLEVAKKNGKSTLLSALLIAFVLLDGEKAPEVYVNAVDRKQAEIIFDEAARMIKASPDLASRFQVLDYKKRITHPDSNGVIVANSADVASKDGINASHIVFDELHRQKTRDLWDVMRYASASRRQPIFGSITTAGESADGVWYEQREYSDRVNDGREQDVRHLGVVYRAMPNDDIDDPATWRKANPSLGVTLREEDFSAELAEAKLVPALMANFKRLRLNVISAGDTAFVDLERWDLCNAHVQFSSGDPIYAGLDLSTVDDLSALVWGRGHVNEGLDVRAKFWLPEQGIARLEREHQENYRELAKDGVIKLTPGEVIDYDFIRAEIKRLSQDYELVKLFVDPANALDLVLRLRDEDGLPVEFLRQGFLSLSAPTKELLRLILSRRIRHDGNHILRSHIGNAVAEQDAAGNIKLSKRKSRRKIDGAAALVNMIAAASAGASANGVSIYDFERLMIL